MGPIQQLGAEAWRDYEVDGVAGSGPHLVLKSDLRALAALIDAGLAALSTAIGVANSPAVVAATQAALFANSAPAAGTLGLVYGDTLANNGFYVKAGAAGVAGWTYTGAGPAGPQGLSNSNGGLIKQTGKQLLAGLRYGACCSLGVMSATLPDINLTPEGEVVEVEDVDFASAANVFTINSFGGVANIKFENQAAASTIPLQTNGGRLRFRKNTSIGTYWRASFNVG